MRHRISPARLLHEDQTDYVWPEAKLDALLADAGVREAAEDVLAAGFDEHDLFCPELVYAACRRRYRRKQTAALLFFLAYRVMQGWKPLPMIGERRP